MLRFCALCTIAVNRLIIIILYRRSGFLLNIRSVRRDLNHAGSCQRQCYFCPVICLLVSVEHIIPYRICFLRDNFRYITQTDGNICRRNNRNRRTGKGCRCGGRNAQRRPDCYGKSTRRSNDSGDGYSSRHGYHRYAEHLAPVYFQSRRVGQHHRAAHAIAIPV